MDVQDHKKNALSEQEILSVQLCHKCGWPFPNPHPSAKHRRAHKRVCGTIEGYKLLDSGSDHSNFAGSDNEHISDDDRRNPNPKRSIKESENSGGMGLISNQSEDELFIDAIPEFSNNGANPSLDKNVGGGGGEVFHVLKDSHVSKDEKTAGTSQPAHGLTVLLQGSIKAGEISDYSVMRGETNQSEITNSISDIGNEKVLNVVSSRPCLESKSSLAISELIVVSEPFHTSELIVVADSYKTDHETGKRSSSLGPCIKDNEKDDEANEDLHCITTSRVLQSDCKLEIDTTSGPLKLKATTTKVEKETLDPQVQSDSQFKLNNVNAETPHAIIVDETTNRGEVLEDGLQFKYDASSLTKHQELRDALSVSEVEYDSQKESIHCSPGLTNEVQDMEEEGNESTPFLSPGETFPAENSVIMIGEFKDYEMLKSGASLDLRAAEEERTSENDKKIPILENFQDAFSNLPHGSVDWSSLNPLESKVEKHVSVPDSGTVFISSTQNLPCTTANVFAGTIYVPKEKSVSIPVDGEVGTAVPDLPTAQSSVNAENVAYMSEKVSNLQNSQNAVSNVSAGMVDNSSSDTFNGDLDKVGVSTPIDRKIDMAVPENLSSVPYGTEGNSSLDSLQDDLKKVGTSALIGDDTSVTANILCPSSSMSTGTSDEFLLDALKDNLKKEGVSKFVSSEFIPPVPPVATEDSKVPAGTLENITSEAVGDDLKKNSVSTPINGTANTSLQGNLPITNSSVLVGAFDKSASQPLADDLRKEVVSAPNDREPGASAHEDLEGALSNIPVVGSSDNTFSEALEDDHEEEGFSKLHDRDDCTSDPDNLLCFLSCVPAGTTNNSSKEASKDALTKECVLTHDFVEVGSSGFRETSCEDNQLLPSAATLSSVKNPEAIIGDFEDHKVLKSSFTFDVGADKEIKLAEDDKKVTVSENPIALKDVPDGNIDNLEDDFRTEGVSIPIHGEVGAFGFTGTSDEESHLLSVADTSPTVDNPAALIEEFKDYKVLKSSFSMDLGAAEETISLENDKKVKASENLPGAVSYRVPSESIDSSPSDALEDDLRKDDVSIPIDGEIDASEFKFNNDVDFGSSSLGNYLIAPNSETNNSEPNNNAERSLTRPIDGKSMQNEDSEPASRQESDVVPLESSTGEQNLQMVKLCGGGNANSHGDDKLVHVVPGNENVQPADEPSASDSTLARVEAMPETLLLVGKQSLGLENSSMGSRIADIGIVEVTTEERLANQSHPTCESLQQLVSSDCLDDARNSDHMDVEAGGSGKFCNSTESPRHINEILHYSEGLKIGEETKVSNSSNAPEFVSERKYEDSTKRSEKTPDGSNFEEVDAFARESQNIRDPSILGPLQDNVDENITKPNLSILAVDNFIVSSSRTDSLEGNWGSVSVLSTQSDVGNVADAEVVSSTDAQAEKLFKKPEKGKEAAMESHSDKSDVFEPPSFMTLVESKPEADEKAGWFPSITNVLNESEGRKKNEEIISKVTNWSTAGKQHSPLKNLLNEAHAETKEKSLSPKAKQLVPAVNNQADEAASASKNNAIALTTTTTTTVSSILGTEMPSNAETVKKEIEKEWNSPARYPIQMKKEKRKGKPYWVPFVCCTSVQQDF